MFGEARLWAKDLYVYLSEVYKKALFTDINYSSRILQKKQEDKKDQRAEMEAAST